VDLQAIRPLLPPGAGSVTLHFALSGLRPDGAAARMLRSLRPANLRLFCTSVVNLFPQAVIPVAVTHTASDYSIVADAPRPQAYEVYCVDAVIQQTKDGEPAAAFTPLYAPSHSGGARGRYWVLRHDEMLAEISPGHEKRLALVDINSQALEVERSTLSVNATCTNRDLPHQLPGDAYELAVPGAGNGLAARLLGSPTLPYRFPGGQAHWRLISHLSLNHHALVPRGLPALRELLTLHDLPQSPVTQRLIEGIVDLDHEETTAWMRHKRGSALMYGLEVRITLDEDAFVGSGIHLFAQVMDEFLALYVQANNYVELVLLAQRDKRELLRCKRRSGTANLA
jgi:type VI secretion system protein ImpG